MKAIKILLFTAVMTLSATGAMAQTDNKAVIDQISKVIKSGQDKKAIESEVKNVLKSHKKDVDVITAIGRAYLEAGDVEKAMSYAQQAMTRDKNYGEAYVLAGDVESAKDDGGAASAWYEQASTNDPKNPVGYVRYAIANSKISPKTSIERLELLRQNVPSFPVDLTAADIYQRAGNIKEALKYFDKADKNVMERGQLADYAMDLFLLNDFEKSLQVSTFGNQKFPRYAALNRLSLYNSTNLKQYDKALLYADRLFNQSDSAQIKSRDYLYYGYAFLGNDRYEEAIDMYNKSLETAEDDANRADALKNIATAYQKMGNMNAAADAYDKYLKTQAQPTAYDLGTLASMWQDYAKNLEGDEKAAALNKADAIWGQIADNFPTAATLATYNRAHIAFELDPESTEGLARPHYETLIAQLANKADRDSRETNYLVEAYRYLGYYYLLKNDKDNSIDNWSKLLEIAPDNAQAKTALEALQKKK